MDISNILTKEQREAGLTLEEDVFEVTLRLGDKVIAVFGPSALIEHIRYTADQAIEWKRSGITFTKGEENDS